MFDLDAPMFDFDGLNKTIALGSYDENKLGSEKRHKMLVPPKTK